MIQVDPPKTVEPDTSNWSEADWERAMLEHSLKRDDASKSGFINDPDFVPNNNGCTHTGHNIRGLVIIPLGKLYRHVCPGCKNTTYWKN